MKFGKFDRNARAFAVAAICALFAAVAVKLGDPIALAAAQNMSTKSDPLYLGYTGRKWDQDYGVNEGRCNRQAVGAVLDGVTPGRLKTDNTRQVATVTGAMMDTGNGQTVDQKDRACIGHALELAGIERGVVWTNTDNGIAYRVIPLGGFTDQGRSCREFVTRMTASARNDEITVRHKACSAGNGVWQIVG